MVCGNIFGFRLDQDCADSGVIPLSVLPLPCQLLHAAEDCAGMTATGSVTPPCLFGDSGALAFRAEKVEAEGCFDFSACVLAGNAQGHRQRPGQ